MKIILQEDLPKLGKKFDVIEVDEQLALNRLLPLRLALVDTPVQRRRFAGMLNDRTSPKPS